MKKSVNMMAVIGLLLLICLATACGNAKQPETTQAPETTAPETTQAPAAADTEETADAPAEEDVTDAADAADAAETPETTEADAAEEITYQQISQEEAAQIMETGEDYILLDVRTQAEYDEGHIPGAICVPNETIGTEEPAELPDKDQLILVYCRSGRRSKEAAGKLAALGYTNIQEFGGINTWTGSVVTD